MSRFFRSIVCFSFCVLALGAAGCGDEHPPVTTDSSKLTPGMENMKNEMMKSFQTKSLGKAPPATPKQ